MRDEILRFFDYKHLPPALAEISEPFAVLAALLEGRLPRCAERSVAFRKLLEAKDAAVRAALPPDKKSPDIPVLVVAPTVQRAQHVVWEHQLYRRRLIFVTSGTALSQLGGIDRAEIYYGAGHETLDPYIRERLARIEDVRHARR